MSVVDSISAARPAPPAEGEWVAVADSAWIVPAPGAQTCRWGSWRSGYCRRPAVAALLRGSSRLPYAYCELHLYGRWLEDGEVRSWRRIA